MSHEVSVALISFWVLGFSVMWLLALISMDLSRIAKALEEADRRKAGKQ